MLPWIWEGLATVHDLTKRSSIAREEVEMVEEEYRLGESKHDGDEEEEEKVVARWRHVLKILPWNEGHKHR